MSSARFDEDANQLRVFIPPVKKLPPNPHIARGAEPLQRALAAPSETAYTDVEWFVEPREDKSLRHRLIACDQASFLTGSASADLQAAHIINAVRSDLKRKREVEEVLTQQRLQDPSLYKFLLDSPTNAILLEASLHVHWDIYGTFCIVPSERDANAMLAALTTLNTEWAKHDPFEGRLRPLDISQPPFANPHWEIVVLHPHALLPDKQPLVIARDRTFYLQGQPAPVSQLSWNYWIAYDDHLRSVMPPHEPLPPFVFNNVRKTLEKPILSFAMIINAHYKLDQFMRDHGSLVSSRVSSFADQMSKLVTAIFYVPPRYAEATGQSQFMDVSGRTRSATVTRASQSTAVIGLQAGNSAYDSEAMADNSVLPNETNRESNTPDAVEPPEAVGEDGLTASEFRLVVTRAKDPLLDAKQRADAAMLMLFGTRRHADPYVRTQLNYFEAQC